MAANGRLLNAITGAIKLTAAGIRNLTTGADLCPSCCDDDDGPIQPAYKVCPCCLTEAECEDEEPRYALAVNFPRGAGIYKDQSGSCFRLTGPFDIDVTQHVGASSIRGRGDTAGDTFLSCAACETGCECAEPTQLALSITGWTTRLSVFGISNTWYEATVVNPMTGSYIIPANHDAADPNIVLQTFSNAVVATGHFGEFGRNDLELYLISSSVERCLFRGGPEVLCRWMWRINTAFSVRSVNATTTSEEAVRGVGFTDVFGGMAPFALQWGTDTVSPCNDGITQCPSPTDDVERGPDGGCGAWTHWPGCPTTPRLYRPNLNGCITVVPV